MLVALERQGRSLASLSPAVGDEPLRLCAVVAAELLAGVGRAGDPVRRVRRAAFVEALLEVLPVLPFDLAAARVHAQIAAALAHTGQPVGAHDLLIAATASANGLGVVTANPAHFLRIPGLRVVPA